MESLLSLCLAGDPVLPDRLWGSWSVAPETLGPLVLTAVLYCTAVARQLRVRRSQGLWQEAGLFAAGLGLLAVGLVSPLCRMAATVAWAHMIQHLILVALAPPLLILGAAPLSALARPRARVDVGDRELACAWNRPGVSAALYGLTIWFWHIPVFYQASLSSVSPHLVMYGSLLIVSLLFWSNIIWGTAGQGKGHGVSIIVLLITLVHTGLLGALLTFSPTPWYSLMGPGALLWGLTPLEDQQLAGLIMWVPMGFIYLIAALAVAASVLAHLNNQSISGRLP